MGRLGHAFIATSLAVLAPWTAANAAVTWSYDWAAADAFIGLSPSGAARSAPTDEVRYTAESVVRFIDNDRNGLISAGDTFMDYVLVRFDALLLGGADNGEIAAGYGGAAGRREITLAAVVSGTQLTGDRYEVGPGGTISLHYDAGPGYTPADFASLGTFSDSNGGAGVVVERASVVAPSGGMNNSATLPNGKIDLLLRLDDTIVPGGFEVAPSSGAPLGVEYARFDGDNVLCLDSGGAAACDSTTQAILDHFGVPAIGANQFQFHTRSERSMTKVLAASVPEPGGFALLGAALCGWGIVRRRRGR